MKDPQESQIVTLLIRHKRKIEYSFYAMITYFPFAVEYDPPCEQVISHITLIISLTIATLFIFTRGL